MALVNANQITCKSFINDEHSTKLTSNIWLTIEWPSVFIAKLGQNMSSSSSSSSSSFRSSSTSSSSSSSSKSSPSFRSSSLKLFLSSLYVIIIFTLTRLPCVNTMNVNSVWSPSNNNLHIIARFAFNKLNTLLYKNHMNFENNYGYIYGNISSISHPNEYKRKGTLLLLSAELFDKLYRLTSSSSSSSDNGSTASGTLSGLPLNDTCQRLSAFIDQYAYDAQCQDTKQADIIRYVPCQRDRKCTGGFESSSSSSLTKISSKTAKQKIIVKSVPGYQFTFAIEDQKEPSFWYLLLVSCAREGYVGNGNINSNSNNNNNNNNKSSIDDNTHVKHNISKISSTNHTFSNGNTTSNISKLSSSLSSSSLSSSSSLLSSDASSTCKWYDTSKDNIVISYNIWFVNGYPLTSSGNLFTHQFSYEKQDMVLYLIFTCLYIILTTLQMYAFIKQRHRNLLVYLFTISLSMHCLGFLFITLHKFVYAHDGIGCLTISVIADVLRIISTGIFILFVLIIVKGWPVTRAQLTAKPLVFISWLVYIIVELLLYTWAKKSQDLIEENDDNYVLPGWISIVIRIAFTIWFVFELRATMMLEQDQQKLRFYLHFGAGIMVWFVHLPIVVIIGNQISQMWRLKLILGFSCSANFLAYAIVTNFIWPTKQSNRFLTHYGDSDYSEELDCYDDTHIDTLGPLTHQNGINGIGNRYVYDNHIHKQSKG